jgi:hypothetical protein
MTEEEIASLFERVAQDLDFPQVDKLISSAERHGKRLRHRRKALVATGSLLVAGAVAATAATGFVPRLAGGLGTNSAATGASPTPSGLAGTATPSSTPSTTPSPSATAKPTPTPSPGATNSSRMQASQIMDDLRGMLPASSTISDVRLDAVEPGSVEFDYNDGQGAVDFMFEISPLSFYQAPFTCSESPWSGAPDEGTRPTGALPQSCVILHLPDGSKVQDWVPYADAFGWYSYTVWDVRPDGTVVWVQVANGINHTLPQVDRAVPPGSFAEWNALVENPVWHL